MALLIIGAIILGAIVLIPVVILIFSLLFKKKPYVPTVLNNKVQVLAYILNKPGYFPESEELNEMTEDDAINKLNQYYDSIKNDLQVNCDIDNPTNFIDSITETATIAAITDSGINGLYFRNDNFRNEDLAEKQRILRVYITKIWDCLARIQANNN